jgi:histidinol-phosphate aminotransferase
VARTFSKAYGLAGLRIGILVGDAAQMAMVRRVASPYNVNAVALAALPEALRDQEYVEHYVAEVRSGRELLEQELRTLGLHYWPSRANFVLVRVGPDIRNSFRLCARAESSCATGIPIRDAKAACV